MADTPPDAIAADNPSKSPFEKAWDSMFGDDPPTSGGSSDSGAASNKGGRGKGSMPPPNNSTSGSPFVNTVFNNPSYALMNSQIGPKSHLPVRLHETNAIGIQRNLNNQAYTNDESENVDRFLARVLRVENVHTEKEGESLLFSWIDSLVDFVTGEDDPVDQIQKNVQITALTDCDIHACAWGKTGVGHPDFSLPNQQGIGGSNALIDHIRDDHHALFTAPGHAKVPVPGEYVWVTWKDLPNRREGLYLGPLDPTNPESVASKDTSRKPPCNKLNSKPANGSGVYNTNEATLSNNWGAALRKRIDAKIERGQHPVGKGIFTGYPDINKHKVQLAEEATLNWVCYTGLRQKSDGSPETELDITAARKFADQYHKKGIRTYVMGYPYRGQEEKFISDITSIASSIEAVGIIINLDNYYDGLDESKLSASELENFALEKFLSATLKEQAKKSGFCLGLTATNIIDRKKVPWKTFSNSKDGVDFCIPQVLLQSYSDKRDAPLTKEQEQETTGGAQQGPTLGQATTFDDIKPSNYKSAAEQIDVGSHSAKGYTSLESFKEKWYARGLDKNKGNEFDTRTLLIMGACQVIEEYWQLMYPDAQVKITSHHRPGDKGNHTTGGAIDIRIEYEGKRLPVLQTWGGLKKLIAGGRIPNGGAGLYLNVSANGIKGTDPNVAGNNSAGAGTHAGPGGSAAVHYDMRGFTYAGTGKAKNTIWCWIDKDGDGKDEVTSLASVKSWLSSNGLQDVRNYIGKANGTWISDQFTPHVTGEVRSMKQVLGLKGAAPMLPTTSGEFFFLKQFEAWKALGFKNMIPGLGMLGNSPKPKGWDSDGYNTADKSPWRMRQDVTWAYTSTRQVMHKVMADAIIWWDWENANYHDNGWPEKRWDIIRELGNATEAAAKLESLKTSSMSDAEKEKIKTYQLGEFLRHSPSPGEELEAKKATAEEPPVEAPKSTIPSTTETTEPPEATTLTEKEKKEIQESIDNKTKDLKTKEDELAALKDTLNSVQTSGTQQEKDKVLADIKAKEEEIKNQTNEINTLKASLSKNEAAEPASQAPTSQGQETEAAAASSEKPCASSGGGGGGRGTAATGLPKGEVKESKIPGVDFVDFGFPTYARKSTNFIIIHNPAGMSGNHQRLAKTLLRKKLGVHFTVEPSGKQRQHVDLELACSHAAPENYSSIGVEAMVRTIYVTPDPRYKVNTGSRRYYESVYKLCKKIVAATTIPLSVPQANYTKGEFYYGWNESAYGGKKSGILAHGSFRASGGQHGDGKMEVLYIALRINGNSAGSAYKMAMKAHEEQSKKTKSQGRYRWGRVIGLKKGEANTSITPAGPGADDAADSGLVQNCPEGQQAQGSNPDGTPICG